MNFFLPVHLRDFVKRNLRALFEVLLATLYLCSSCGWCAADMFSDWQSGKVWKANRSHYWYGSRSVDLDSSSQRVWAGNGIMFCSLKLGEILLQWRKPHEGEETEASKEELYKIECSLYNRGDDGDMNEQQFRMLFESYQERITKCINIKKTKSVGPKNTEKLKTEVWKWESPQGCILLIAGISVLGHKYERMEYMRLVLLRDRRDIRNAGAGRRTSHLRESVTHEEDGTVWIKGIPMVDQGSKGYCVPASVARIFAHYGATNVDMHTLAAICNTATSGGTSLHSMRAALKKISWHFGVTLTTVAEYWQKRGKHLEKYDRKIKTRTCLRDGKRIRGLWK